MKVRYPIAPLKNTSCRLVVDPEHVNGAFDEVARMINGGLMGENICQGANVDMTALQNPRSLVCLSFNYACNGLSPGPYVVLCTVQYNARCVGAAVYGASKDVHIHLSANASTLVHIVDAADSPPERFWEPWDYAPAITAGQELRLYRTAGSFLGITVWLTVEHAA